MANAQSTGFPTSVGAAQTTPLSPAPIINAVPLPAGPAADFAAEKAAAYSAPGATDYLTKYVDPSTAATNAATTTTGAAAAAQPTSFQPLPPGGFKGAGVASLPWETGAQTAAPAAAASAAPASAGSGISGMLGKAWDWAGEHPIPAAMLGVTAATAMGAGKPSPINQQPLGQQWGTGNATGDQYMKDHPETFGNWKGWTSPGPANTVTPQTPGPTPMSPVGVTPYKIPTGNQQTGTINQPYNVSGLYDPRRFYQQPQYNTGGPVNNAHGSGSGMQQGMTNSFNEGGGLGNTGGIGALSPSSFAQGGNTNYPRRTGVIEGPGTETSDSIPAMLSDGEFVFTAKAVKNAGRGSRRDGAKRMYQLMHMLEHGGQV